jgi:hypothetical protein
MPKMILQSVNRFSKIRVRSVGILLLTLAALLCVSSCTSHMASTPDPAWDRLFHRADGWTGADGVQTVDLGNGRIFWLFGDTWIGSVRNGNHTSNSVLVNNSAALQTGLDLKTKDPASTRIDFLWGQADSQGNPSAWIKPENTAKAGNSQLSNNPIDSSDWYWPTGDGIVLPDADDRNRLILFLSRIARRMGDLGVWGFQGAGGSIVIISNYDLPPAEWMVMTYDNPHSIGMKQANADPARFETTWGMALIADEKRENGATPYLFIYGIREKSSINKEMILARSPMTSPERHDTWEFYAGNQGWSPHLSDAVSLADAMVNEFSIDRLTIHDREVFVLIQSDNAFNNQIFLRTAYHPEGPWSQPVMIFDAAEARNCKGCFAYAAKSHTALSREGELLVSYVINSTDFDVMVNDADIYRPRFIRVLLDRIISHAR